MPRKAGTNGKKGNCVKTHSLADITDDEGYYCVKGDLLWKYRAVSAEFENLQLRIASNKIALQAEMEKHPEIKALRDEQAALLGQQSVAIKELEEVQRQISEKLGIDLKTCGIDDRTGRIHVVNTETGQTEPLSPAKKVSAKGTRRSRAGTATT